MRPTEDRLITTRIKKDKQTRSLIERTWEPLLEKDVELPPDWIHNSEVLVGSARLSLMITCDESNRSVCNKHFPSPGPRPGFTRAR